MSNRLIKSKEPKEILGLNRITKKRILELCKKNKLYQTPSLNDVLYLHYQGFQCIEELEEYTELKCLWLECNAISEIQGLSKQSKLKCLFLQSNLVKKIENLQFCRELDTLNLSQNHIRKIENCGIEVLPLLNTLNLSSNYLNDFDSLQELENCSYISVLDLSNNRIDDILVVKIFSKMPELKVLVLQGNPVVSKIPQYRKTMILECEKLTYLDSRPVFPKDRACAEAWKRGGYEAERKENERWNRKERKKMRDSVNATIRLRNRHRKIDDHLELITSSESEDDEDNTNKGKSIWDEVSGNDVKESNSDTTISSTNSGSTDDKSSLNHFSEVDDAVMQNQQNCATESEEKTESIESPAEIELTLQKDIEEMEEFQAMCTEEMEEFQAMCTEDQAVVLNTDNTSDNKANDSTMQEAKDKTDYLSALEQDQLDIYDPLKEIDNIMNTIIRNEEQAKLEKQQNFRILESEKIPSAAVHEVQQTEESLAINEQLKTDFEKLSNNMSDFIQEITQESNESAQQIIDLTDDLSSNDTDVDSDVIRDRLVDQWDRETRIFSRKLPEIWINDRPCNAKNEREICEAQDFSAKEKFVKNIKNSNIIEVETYGVEREVKISKNIDQLLQEYKPLDITSLTRRSDEAWNSFEKETKQLKDMLQKLELENEKIFSDIDEPSDTSPVGGQEMCDGDQQESVTNEVTIEGKQDLVSQENIKLNTESIEISKSSYEIPFNDNEQKVDEEPLEQQTDIYPSQTIRQVINSFNDFYKEITAKNRAELLEESIKQRKRVPTTPEQKSQSLQQLVEQPKLRSYHCDSQEDLDSQLTAFRQKQSKKIQKMVNRIYEQRDRYNDSLELIDGRLRLVNQQTGEIQDLPKHQDYAEHSDDTDYDTAESGEDDENEEACFRKMETQSNINQKPWYCQEKQNQLKYASTAAESDESDQEDLFYSMEPRTSSLHMFANVDESVFDKMDFEKVALTQQDEDHIVQCARSYEELRNTIKLNKHEEGRQQAMSTTQSDSKLQESMKASTNALDLKLNNAMKNNLLKNLNENSDSKDLKPTPSESDQAEMQRTAVLWNIPEMTSKIFEYKISNPEESNDMAAFIDNTNQALNTDAVSNELQLTANESYQTEMQKTPMFSNIPEATSKIFECEISNPEESNNMAAANQQLTTNSHSSESNESNSIDLLKTSEIFNSLEKLSEEEKYNIENNIDIEGITENNIHIEGISEKSKIENSKTENNIIAADRLKSDIKVLFSNINNYCISESEISSSCTANVLELVEDCMRRSDSKNNVNESAVFHGENVLFSNKFRVLEYQNAVQCDSNSEEKKSTMKTITNIEYEFMECVDEITESNFETFLEPKSNVPCDSDTKLNEEALENTTNKGVLECKLESNNEIIDEFETIADSNKFEPLEPQNTDQSDSVFKENKNFIEETANIEVLELPIENTKNEDVLDCKYEILQTSDLIIANDCKTNAISDKFEDLQPQNIAQHDSESKENKDTLENTSNINILECNLEILGSNDEIIDSITVNAQLHYDN